MSQFQHTEFLVKKFYGLCKSQMELDLGPDWIVRMIRFVTSFSEDLEADYNEFSEMFSTANYALNKVLEEMAYCIYKKERFEYIKFSVLKNDHSAQGRRSTKEEVWAELYQETEHAELVDEVNFMNQLKGLAFTIRDLVSKRADFLAEAARTRRKERT